MESEIELEHVVPAKTIHRLLTECALVPLTNEKIAEMLHEVTVHLVKATDEPSAARDMRRDREDLLVAHYTNPNQRLPDRDHFEVCWSRYLNHSGAIKFALDLNEVTTLTEHFEAPGEV